MLECTVLCLYKSCLGLSSKLSSPQLARTWQHHCSQNAVIGLHCPCSMNVYISTDKENSLYSFMAQDKVTVL